MDQQKRAAALLEIIQQTKPDELRVRYPELIVKRRAETISSDEYEELFRLTEQAEAFNVRWLEALADLADLRHMTLPALMQDLGIQAPPSD
jgi:hypothetical protein